MSKHTPGPWRVAESQVSPSPCFIQLWVRSLGKDQSKDDAICGMAQFNSEERDANARLIAAAPDMLAMCSRIISETESPGFLDLYDAYLKVHGEPYRGDMFCMDLRATIAKAKGESE